VPPPFEIDALKNTGRTDNSGLDTLWSVWLSEPDRDPERFLFWRSDRRGVPTQAEMREAIRARARGFANAESALDQFRAQAVPHPHEHPTRRSVQLDW
jgi:hypothetical protein